MRNTFIKGINHLVTLGFLLLPFLFVLTAVYASETSPQKGMCDQDVENAPECGDGFINLTPAPHDKKTSEVPRKTEGESSKFVVCFFWGKGCPHCMEEKLFLEEMKKQYPSMEIKHYEVWYNKQNAIFLSKMTEAYHRKASGVPVTFIGENVFIGFSEQTQKEIADSIRKCLSIRCIDPNLIASRNTSVDTIKGESRTGEISEITKESGGKDKDTIIHIPWTGNLDVSETSILVMTFVIAGLDSFNPCAFFVLFSLLGLLIYAQSRKKMLLIGSIFIFFSGFIYFLFMAAWLNLFLLMGQVAIITKIAGCISILIAAINIKDFFLFQKGVSLTIPESAKPKLFDRMRRLLKSTSLFSILIGTAVLAIVANSYELLCTAGFPMLFTRILTLNNLSPLSYYIYLLLYNVIYVIPLFTIVMLFTITLGRKKLSEWQGRVLKLVSGTMMLGLGGVLLLNPPLLNNILVSFLLLLGSLVVSSIVVFFMKKKGYTT